jgi:hypothetical protein
MLSPNGLPAADIQLWRVAIWVGVFCSQPALLAIWAAFGPETALVQLPKATFLVCLLSLCGIIGGMFNRSWFSMFDIVIEGLLPLCQYAVLLFAFGIIGRRFGWHVSVLKSRQPAPDQFSVLTLLMWMASAAVLFSVFGWIVRNSVEMDVASIKYWKQFTQVLVTGLVIGAFSISSVFNVALVLRDRFAIRDLIWFSVAVVGQIAALYSLASSVRVPIYETLTQTGLFLLAFNCTLFATLWIVRLLGFRLLQRSDSLTPRQQAC